MSSAADTLRRRILPRALVALSRVNRPARLAARARRGLGRDGRVELFFAFEDPCSAVAALDLEERLARRSVTLVLRPVVRRGIAGDPAAQDKRRYAIGDARRLAARAGLELTRGEPVPPKTCDFLAAWAASAPQGAALRRFCTQALRELWFTAEDEEPVSEARFAPIWREQFGADPPRGVAGERALRRNERRMRLHWMYETPAAWVHGQWFFAHDRPLQIAQRLDELGWSAT